MGGWSNIVIGLYILDMWSVLCVMYVYGGIYHTDRTVRTGHVVSVFVMYEGGITIYSDWTVHTGHVVSVVCSVCVWWNII